MKESQIMKVDSFIQLDIWFFFKKKVSLNMISFVTYSFIIFLVYSILVYLIKFCLSWSSVNFTFLQRWVKRIQVYHNEGLPFKEEIIKRIQ